jgi:TPR repeat protein
MFEWLRKRTVTKTSTPDAAAPVKEEPRGQAYSEDDEVRWFRKAAEKGSEWGQFNLGLRYALGQGVPQDFAEAAKWLQRGAAQGHAEAAFYLGQLQEQGQGMPADPVEAHKWYHLAASHGLRQAQTAKDQLQKRLTAGQLAEAQRRAASHTPRKETFVGRVGVPAPKPNS